MRMWNVNPRKMCNQHLLGEHVETHMFVGTINKNKSIQGYVNNNLVEIHNLKNRHEALAREMKNRGMNHKSILPKYKIKTIGKVNPRKNLVELSRRCKNCRRKIKDGI